MTNIPYKHTVKEGVTLVTNKVQAFIEAILQKNIGHDQISVGEGTLEDQIAFNTNCQVFNLRIQAKPWIIVFCEGTDDVINTYQAAIANELPIRVRAGGHDHEGECTGTNTVLIDVSRMNTVEVDKEKMQAVVGPGNRFIRLTSALADEDVMIPHGTCATVGISGFIMGGGWGPWTRAKGMGCEWLIGATVVNGQGVAMNVSETENQELLWALRGGGGMSYGIVTKFIFKVFALPPKLFKFELTWNPYNEFEVIKPTEEGEPNVPVSIPAKKHKTVDILARWEQVISANEPIENEHDTGLIGTNLKVNGLPASLVTNSNPERLYHNCTMYGYWQGSGASLVAFIKESFAGVMPDVYCLDGMGGTEVQDVQTGCKTNIDDFGAEPEKVAANLAPANAAPRPYGETLMSSWDRESFHKVQEGMNRALGQNDGGKPLPPDFDKPAPHKITSRLANWEGLKANGYAALLETLTSDLIFPKGRSLGLFQYITLGAIIGPYYHNNNGAGSAFPWPKKAYTIQYQTWWNSEWEEKLMGQHNYVYRLTNRALDWMQRCRDAEIPNTEGAFISFKDASIPTETYFAQNYKPLIEIKNKMVDDPYNHLRIRKSII